MYFVLKLPLPKLLPESATEYYTCSSKDWPVFLGLYKSSTSLTGSVSMPATTNDILIHKDDTITSDEKYHQQYLLLYTKACFLFVQVFLPLFLSLFCV